MNIFTLTTIIAFGLSSVPFASSQIDAGVSQPTFDALQDWRHVVDDFNLLIDKAFDGPNLIDEIAKGAGTLIKDDPSRELNALITIEASFGEQELTDKITAAIQKLKEGLAGDAMLTFLNTMSQSKDQDEIGQKAFEMAIARCCYLYPQMDIVWEGAATGGGIANLLDFRVGRPRVCRESLVCATDDPAV